MIFGRLIFRRLIFERLIFERLILSTICILGMDWGGTCCVMPNPLDSCAVVLDNSQALGAKSFVNVSLIGMYMEYQTPPYQFANK